MPRQQVRRINASRRRTRGIIALTRWRRRVLARSAERETCSIGKGAAVLCRSYPRVVMATATCLLAVALYPPNRVTAQQGDIFSSSSGAQSCFILSITSLNTVDRNGVSLCDIKIRCPKPGFVGYDHSITVPCSVAMDFQPGEDIFQVTIQASDRRGDILVPRPPFLPKTVPGKDASLTFAAAVEGCLNMIKREAAADSQSPINRLLKALAEIPVTIHPRPAKDTSNSTAYSAPGKPVEIYWTPVDKPAYDADSAALIPCATLLHELTHAWENYNGITGNGEVVAIRAENWLIWRMKGQQRTKDADGNDLPKDQVIWPQAAAAGPQ